MKKALLSILCVVLVVAMLPLSAFAAKKVYERDVSIDVSGSVGQAMNEWIYYEDYDVRSGVTVQLWPGKTANLSQYGLSINVGNNQCVISGTPTKAGTAYYYLRADDDRYTYYITIKVNITAPVEKTVDVNFAVGEDYSITYNFADYGIKSILDDTNWYDIFNESGLLLSSNNDRLTIYGTPVIAGTCKIICRFRDGSKFTANITITEKSAPVEKTIELSYDLGKEIKQTIVFADYGFPAQRTDIYNGAVVLGVRLGDAISCINLFGTPNDSGTEEIRVTFKDGSKFTIKVTVIPPMTKDVAVTYEVGKAVDQTFSLVNYGFPDTAGRSWSYPEIPGLKWERDQSYTSLRLYGTPTQEVTGIHAYIKAKDKSILNIYINVIAPSTPSTPDDPTPDDPTPDDPTPTTPDDPTPVTPADTYVFPFTDVLEKDWFYKDVYNANKMGLINGKTATLYKPNDNMTYAEAIKLAACMNQYYNEGKVTLGNGTLNWYDTFVDYARMHGIPWDYDDYNAKITRRDYVHIFYYALPKENYKAINMITAIPDVKVTDKYADEILAFYNAGILTGSDSKGTFNPSSNIKRSEVAAILSRMMDATTRKTFSLK